MKGIRSKRFFPYCLNLGLLFGLSGCASLGPGAQAPSDQIPSDPAPSALVFTAQASLGSGQLAYAVRRGQSPAVIFQSGLGDGMDTWAKVAPQVTGNLGLTYDRLGYGKSASVNAKRDPCSIAQELHELLEKTHVSPPYILVGHSIGGLYQYVFAKMYPGEVSALVLLDPTHPNHWREMQLQAPTAAKMIRVLKSTVFNRAARREFDQQTVCLNEAIKLDEPLEIPTTFLFSTEFSPGEGANYKNMLMQLRANWIELLPDAKVINAVGSGHYIQTDKPQLVIDALNAVLSQ